MPQGEKMAFVLNRGAQLLVKQARIQGACLIWFNQL
jgi:hypothetical protein